MLQLQHQFNSIVETTQLTNDQIPGFYCHCKCSKCPSPAPTQAFSDSALGSYLATLEATGLW